MGSSQLSRPLPADTLVPPSGAGAAALGTEIKSRALEVAQIVLERWVKQHPDPSGSAHNQVHRDILRTTKLASITLGHFLVTGQFPTAKERDALAAPGKAPMRETIGLDDLTKLYLSWRDVACEKLESYARQLEVDMASLEAATSPSLPYGWDSITPAAEAPSKWTHRSVSPVRRSTTS